MTELNLVLIRHATAEDKAVTKRDDRRRLTEKGMSEARALASAFQALGIPEADVILTSGYPRAEETLLPFPKGPESVHRIEDDFSPEGSSSAALRCLTAAFDGPERQGMRTVWVCSHNPLLDEIVHEVAREVLKAIHQMPKASALWLQWEDRKSFPQKTPRLRAFLPKPRVDSIEVS